MADGSNNGVKPALTSEWGGLSPHLIASFFAVRKGVSDDKKTIRWERDPDQPEVRAPISDSNIDIAPNWQSPFENVGIDQKLSSFSAMLQAGGFSSLLAQIQASLPSIAGVIDPLAAQAKTLEGRSNLTKLNSTQVFQGLPPLKLPVTLHFRAFQDAKKEVEDPLDQLVKWSLPQEIAPDGPIVGLAAGSVNAYASKVPQIIGFKFANRLLAPMVIEHMLYPLNEPLDVNGNKTRASIALTIASLTALDKNDWITSGDSSTFTSFKF